MMNNKVVGTIAFILGAAIGSVVTWKLVKTRYEQIAQEEIDSVKEVFSARKETSEEVAEENTEDAEEDAVDPDMLMYEKKLVESGYVNFSAMQKPKQVQWWEKEENKEEGGNPMKPEPYVIPPEEFDELDGYKTRSLTYFSDGVLYDDIKQEIVDIGLVGAESLDHFGEYERDSVFVRNERTKTDYEILLDMSNYSDIKKEYRVSGNG